MMSGDKRRTRFSSGPSGSSESQRPGNRPKTKRLPARPGTAQRLTKPRRRGPKPQAPSHKSQVPSPKPQALRPKSQVPSPRPQALRPKPQVPIPNPQSPIPNPEGQRLQKILAAAGLGSRRQCEELITSGRVEVDRQMVTQLGTRVDPGRQEIQVDGQPLSVGRRVYYAVNKPKGVVTTNRDPSGRPRVIDLVPGRDARLFAIGRLDLSSEGLILVTNDGELANRLAHPRYGVAKTYLAQVAGRPATEVLAQLCRGVRLAEGLARAESVRRALALEGEHVAGDRAPRGPQSRDPAAAGQGGAQGAAAGANGRRPGAAGQTPPRPIAAPHAGRTAGDEGEKESKARSQKSGVRS